MDKTTEYFVRKNIKTFIDETILMPHPTLPDTYNLTSSGFRKLQTIFKFPENLFRIILDRIKYFMNTRKTPLNQRSIKKIEAIGNYV